MSSKLLSVFVLLVCVFSNACSNSDQPTRVGPRAAEPNESTTNSATNDMLRNRKDLTPEDAVRAFIIAVSTKNELLLRSIALPMDGLEILLQGESIPEQRRAEFLASIHSLKLRRLAINETITIAGEGSVTMDADRVNESRVQITFPNNPIPFDVLRAKNGLWWVNPEYVIESRRSAMK